MTIGADDQRAAPCGSVAPLAAPATADCRHSSTSDASRAARCKRRCARTPRLGLTQERARRAQKPDPMDFRPPHSRPRPARSRSAAGARNPPRRRRVGHATGGEQTAAGTETATGADRDPTVQDEHGIERRGPTAARERRNRADSPGAAASRLSLSRPRPAAKDSRARERAARTRLHPGGNRHLQARSKRFAC